MRHGILAVVGVVAVTLAGAADAFAQKGGGAPKCSDIPLQVEVFPMTGIGMSGDDLKQTSSGATLYTNGVDGVYNLIINVCSGSYDATFGLVTSKRAVKHEPATRRARPLPARPGRSGRHRDERYTMKKLATTVVAVVAMAVGSAGVLVQAAGPAPANTPVTMVS